MNLILDEQLPPLLVGWLAGRGHSVAHVRDLGLRSSPDKDVWARAVRDGAAILTKDQDYAIRRAAVQDGPQIVWLRLGNLLAQPCVDKVAELWPEIEDRLAKGDVLIEAPGRS